VFIGENLSAQIGYMLGRFFGKNILDHQEIIEINLFKKKFAVNLLFAVFLSKIVYIPDDIVNIGR
jgi:membrane protein DedA with SNARE-associated domain